MLQEKIFIKSMANETPSWACVISSNSVGNVHRPMLVSRTISYDEDDTQTLLDFVNEATLILEANDDIEDQGQEVEPTSPPNITKSTAY